MITAMMAGVLAAGSAACAQNARQAEPVPGKDGNKYVPYGERTGNESIVYFTRDLSPEGLRKAYEAVCGDIGGRVAVKLHTGEQNGPNIIPSSWVKELIEKDIPDATIVETNTYYTGDRYTTEQHRRTLEVNGWTFCPVDIMDEEDTLTLPVRGGKWFDRMSMGSHITDYNSMVVLTHFKGHSKHRLQLNGRSHPFQGTFQRRLRRQQQEHRHRLRRRPHRQGLDPYHSRSE